MLYKKQASRGSVIKKSFEYITTDTYVHYQFYISHCSGLWMWKSCLGTLFNQDISRVEGVQRRATKIVPSLAALPYVERLKCLKLPSLLHRCRQWYDFCIQLLHNQFDMDTTLLHPTMHTTTRGHNFKLQKLLASILSSRNCFSVRVIS